MVPSRDSAISASTRSRFSRTSDCGPGCHAGLKTSLEDGSWSRSANNEEGNFTAELSCPEGIPERGGLATSVGDALLLTEFRKPPPDRTWRISSQNSCLSSRTEDCVTKAV